MVKMNWPKLFIKSKEAPVRLAKVHTRYTDEYVALYDTLWGALPRPRYDGLVHPLRTRHAHCYSRKDSGHV